MLTLTVSPAHPSGTSSTVKTCSSFPCQTPLGIWIAQQLSGLSADTGWVWPSMVATVATNKIILTSFFTFFLLPPFGGSLFLPPAAINRDLSRPFGGWGRGTSPCGLWGLSLPFSLPGHLHASSLALGIPIWNLVRGLHPPEPAYTRTRLLPERSSQLPRLGRGSCLSEEKARHGRLPTFAFALFGFACVAYPGTSPNKTGSTQAPPGRAGCRWKRLFLSFNSSFCLAD